MLFKWLGNARHVTLLAVIAGALGFCAAAPVQAQPWLGSSAASTPDAPTVHLSPLLGAQSPAAAGWLGFVVNIANANRGAFTGQVTLHVARGQRRVPPGTALASASVSLGPGESTTFQLAAYGADAPELTLSLIDGGGRLVSQANTVLGPVNQLHLFDLDGKSSIVPELNHRATTRRIQDSVARESLTASEATRDVNDTHRLLPRRVAEYAATTLVLCASSSLETLPEADWQTLGGWILAGGSLAVSIDSSLETAQRLQRLAGGAIVQTTWSERLFDSPTPDWLASGRPRPTLEESPALTPLPESAIRTLIGASGANLRPSDWGAVASYGLGEVHLLGFNPNRPELSATDWALDKLQGLARHAKQRRRSIALPLGVQNPDDSRSFAVRQVLCRLHDPSTALILAALVLLAYAVLAGPVNFGRSRAERSPSAPLARLAGLSLATFSLLFGISYYNYGGRPWARHLSLIEAGAAMPRAAITRFRAFHDSSFTTKQFAPHEAWSSLALVNYERDAQATTRAGPLCLVIEQVVNKPWKALLVREEGIVDLGAGIDLALEGDALAVHNRTRRDLIGVVVRAVDGRTYYYDVIPAGQRVLTNDSKTVQVTGAPATSVHFPLLIGNFDWRLEKVAPGLTAAWQALEALRPGEVDWWPPDVPVLLAQLRGGEGRAADTDYPIESDRVLLRVIGYGSSS